MVRHHVRLVQNRTRTINRIRGMLDRHDIPMEGSAYSVKNMAMLEIVDLDSPHDEMVIRQCARQVRYLTDEIKELDRCLEAEAGQNGYARLPAA